MTTTVYFTGAVGTPQDLFTITYPLADTEQTLISNVSKATTAVVTTQTPLPGTFLDGNLVLVTGVGGMTELATAGIDSGRTFYANVISANTFGLYTDAALTANVDSTGFTSAVANTGGVSFFTVPSYNSVASPQTVVFNEAITSSGSQIALDTTTGVISLDSGSDYVLSAVVNTSRAVPANSTAGYQWYDLTNDVAFGAFTKFGETCTSIITAGTALDVVLKVYSDTDTFDAPNQITSGSFNVQLSVPV